MTQTLSKMISQHPDTALALGGVEAVDARFYDDTTLVVELSPDAYASLDAVDAAALKDVRLVVAATTRAAGDLAFRSRCFVGGAEDLACGVAHCGLAPYWAPRLGADGFMRARQDSPTGARLDVALDGDDVVLLRGRVARDTFREKLRRGVRRLADALIAPLRAVSKPAVDATLGGGVFRVDRLERPQLLRDAATGRPTHCFAAALFYELRGKATKPPSLVSCNVVLPLRLGTATAG